MHTHKDREKVLRLRQVLAVNGPLAEAVADETINKYNMEVVCNIRQFFISADGQYLCKGLLLEI